MHFQKDLESETVLVNAKDSIRSRKTQLKEHFTVAFNYVDIDSLTYLFL